MPRPCRDEEVAGAGGGFGVVFGKGEDLEAVICKKVANAGGVERAVIERFAVHLARYLPFSVAVSEKKIPATLYERSELRIYAFPGTISCLNATSTGVVCICSLI